MTWYHNDGTSNTYIESKSDVYNYWFGFGKCLFEFEYDDFTYNFIEKRYECGEIKLSEFTIEKGMFEVKNNKPSYVEFDIVGKGKYAVRFSLHGEISISLPTKPIYTETIYLDYNLTDDKTLEEAINYRLDGLNINYLVEDLGNNKCRISFSYSNYREIGIVESLLTNKGNTKISNAHDVFLDFAKNAYIDDLTLVIPFDLSNPDNYSLLSQTIDDLKNNRTDYAEKIDMGDEEEGQEYYMYNLYLWYDYEPGNYFIDIKNGWATNLFTKITISSTDINEYKDGLRINFYVDFNHDGMMTSDEKEYLLNYLPKAQRLLNFNPDGCTFDYSSN